MVRMLPSCMPFSYRSILCISDILSVVVMSHFDKVVHLPDGFETIATTKNSEFAGIAHKSLPIFGMCALARPG